MVDANGERMLTIGDIALELGVHRTTIDHYVHRGLLKPDYIWPARANGQSGRRVFSRETVDRFIQSCTCGEYHGGRLYSISEICDMLCVSRHEVISSISNGFLKPDIVLPSPRDNKSGMRKFTKATIVAFIQQQVGGGDEHQKAVDEFT